MIMLVFAIFMTNVFMVAEREASAVKETTEESYKVQLIDRESFMERQEKIERVFHENLPLYMVLIAVNLFIFLIFFAGLALNILLIYEWHRKRNIIKITVRHRPVKWGISDIARVAIMFYAFAYIFIVLEIKLSHIFPVLNDRNFRMIFNTSVMDIVGIGFVLNFVIFVYKEKLSTIGITLKNFMRNVVYGIAGYVAAVPLLLVTLIITTIVIMKFNLKPPVQPIVDMLIKEEKIPILIYSSIFAAIVGPVMEEIFFRGFMYNALRKYAGVFWSIMITSVMFSLLHAHWVGFLPILILGILLSYLYEKTGSLVPSFIVHIMHNLASLFMVFLVRILKF